MDRNDPLQAHFVSLEASSKLVRVDLYRRSGTDAPLLLRIAVRGERRDAVLHYDGHGIPERFEAPGGQTAGFRVQGSHIAVSTNGSTKMMAIPADLRRAIIAQRARYGQLGAAPAGNGQRRRLAPLPAVADVMIPVAHAQASQTVTISRQVSLLVRTRVPASLHGRRLRIDARCKPFTCRPAQSSVSAGTVGDVAIHLVVSVPRSKVPPPSAELKWSEAEKLAAEEKKRKAESSFSIGGAFISLLSFASGPLGKVANTIGLAMNYTPGKNEASITELAEEQAYKRQLTAQESNAITEVVLCLSGQRLGTRCRTSAKFRPFAASGNQPRARELRFDFGRSESR